jgi:hypothetical protein
VSGDLLRELGIDPTEPKVAAAIADAELAGNIMSTLVTYRLHLHGDKEIAQQLGWSAAELFDFERLGGDPTVSQIQRYARALGLRLELTLAGNPDIERRTQLARDGYLPTPPGTPPVDHAAWDAELAAAKAADPDLAADALFAALPASWQRTTSSGPGSIVRALLATLRAKGWHLVHGERTP